jgi:hypothetical protein
MTMIESKLPRKLALALTAAVAIFAFSGVVTEVSAKSNAGNIGKQISATASKAHRQAAQKPRRRATAAERRRAETLARKTTNSFKRKMSKVHGAPPSKHHR